MVAREEAVLVVPILSCVQSEGEELGIFLFLKRSEIDSVMTYLEYQRTHQLE